MDTDSLTNVVARRIARDIRSVAPLEPCWMSFKTIGDLLSSLVYTDAISRDFVESLADLPPHLALPIHQELTLAGDEWGVILSLLLSSLQSLSIELSGPRALDRNINATLCAEIAALLSPPELTHFKAVDTYPSFITTSNFLRILSESPCAPKLRSLTVVCPDFDESFVHSLRKFENLNELRFARGYVPLTALNDLILCLPLLSDVSVDFVSENSVYSLLPLLGASKQTFNAPNLTSLRIPIRLNPDEMKNLLGTMEDHALARKVREMPLASLNLQNYEMIKRALELMPLEVVTDHPTPWETIKDLLPIARSLKVLCLGATVREPHRLDEAPSSDSYLRFSQDHADFLAQHTPLLEVLSLCSAIKDDVNLSSLSHLKTLDVRQMKSNSPVDATTTQLNLTLPISIQNFALYSDYGINLSNLRLSLNPLRYLTTMSIGAPCFSASQLEYFFGALPLSLQKIEIEELLTKTYTRAASPTLVSLNLPQLLELSIIDSQFCTQNINVQFSVAPRLVFMQLRADASQALCTMKSLMRFPRASEMLQTLRIDPEGPLGLQNQDTRTAAAMEIAKCTRLSYLYATRLIVPVIVRAIVAQRTSALTLLDIRDATILDNQAKDMLQACRLLTTINFTDVDGLTGIWWLEHQRLERVRLSVTNSTPHENEHIQSLNLNVSITPERLPNLKSLSAMIHRSANIRVCGLEKLIKLEVNPTGSVTIENNCSLEILFVRFGAQHCQLSMVNLPNLRTLEVACSPSVSGLNTQLEGEFPELDQACLLLNYTESIDPAQLALELVSHAPNIKTLRIKSSQAVDREAIVKAAPNLSQPLF